MEAEKTAFGAGCDLIGRVLAFGDRAWPERKRSSRTATASFTDRKGRVVSTSPRIGTEDAWPSMVSDMGDNGEVLRQRR